MYCMQLHKQNASIKPIVNCRNSHTYNLATLNTQKLKQTMNIPYTRYIHNSEIYIMFVWYERNV
jgi:hypothetical protein